MSNELICPACRVPIAAHHDIDMRTCLRKLAVQAKKKGGK